MKIYICYGRYEHRLECRSPHEHQPRRTSWQQGICVEMTAKPAWRKSMGMAFREIEPEWATITCCRACSVLQHPCPPRGLVCS